MKKENKYLLIGVLILIIVGGQLGLFSIFNPSTNDFIQYTGIPSCSGSVCSWFTNEQVASKTVEINTGKNNFRFESTVKDRIPKKRCKTLEPLCSYSTYPSTIEELYVDEDGCQHWRYPYKSLQYFGYHRNPCGERWDGNPGGWYTYWDNGRCQQTCGACGESSACMGGGGVFEDYGGAEIYEEPGCYQEIDVYKNNQLIDTLYSEEAFGVNQGTYYDNSNLDSGVGVDIRNNWFYASSCSAYQNQYNFFLSSDSISLDISSPKEEYLEGEDIQVEVEVNSILQDTINAVLTIDYEVPTILGSKTSSSSKEVNIVFGKNIFTYTIPTTEPVRVLKIKPKIIILYPTNLISGVNYNFGSGENLNIHSQSNFEIGSSEEGWSEIQITSLAGFFEEQLGLTEEELALLNASLQEKLALIEEYKGNLAEQADLIDQLSATLDEKIALVQALQLNINEQNSLISQLELNLQEKIELVNALELNLAEQAQTILALTSITEEQADLIDSLGLNIIEQAEIISQMELTVFQQSIIIEDLNLNIQQQAQIINNLNINLQQKIELISQLELTNQEQVDLIAQMNLSFSEQQAILDALNVIISDDAQQIIDLQLTISQSASYINDLELTVSQQADLIILLNLNINEQADLINQLSLNNEETAQLISNLNLQLNEQASLISQLQLTIDDDAEIISNLNLLLSEEAEIINLLYLTIDEQIALISQLELSFAEEQKLINQLNLTIQEQQAILDGLDGNGFDLQGIWDEYMIWIIIAGGLFVALILFKK